MITDPEMPEYVLRCVNAKCEQHGVSRPLGRRVPQIPVICKACGWAMPIFGAYKRKKHAA